MQKAKPTAQRTKPIRTPASSKDQSQKCTSNSLKDPTNRNISKITIDQTNKNISNSTRDQTNKIISCSAKCKTSKNRSNRLKDKTKNQTTNSWKDQSTTPKWETKNSISHSLEKDDKRGNSLSPSLGHVTDGKNRVSKIRNLYYKHTELHNDLLTFYYSCKL